MSNNAASAIRAALNTHISAVTQIKQVVTGRSSDASSGYPFVRIYLVGIENQPMDNAPSDYRTYTFAVDVIQENTNKSKADAEADFQDCLDAVLDKLNAKWDLPSGSTPQVDNTVIRPSPVREVEMPFGPCLVCSILVECKTLIY